MERNELRTAWTGMWLLLLLLTPPVAVQAQFTYTTNNGAITITKYTGPGGAVIIPSSTNGLPVIKIAQSAFSSCTNVTSVVIPDSVTSIEPSAFYACRSLASLTLGTGVTNIGLYAFASCRSLTSVAIPASVILLQSPVFLYCIGLTNIAVNPHNSNYCSVDGVLFNKSQTTLICYPAGKAGSCTIPAGVTNILDDSFAYCGGLASVTIPNTVKSIGGSAFWNCPSLTSVTIPNSVTRIANRAFYECNGLTNIMIGIGATFIGYDAFDCATNLTAILVDPQNATYGSVDGALLDKSQKMLVKCPWGKAGAFTIPDDVNSIGGTAFYACPNLTNLTIGIGVTNISGYAFADCSALTSVTIPNSVASIGDHAFWKCSALTSVTIGDGVTSIAAAVFSFCTSLEGVYFMGNAPALVPGDTWGNSATVYRAPWPSGWHPTFAGRPTALWYPTVPYTYTSTDGRITITGYTGTGGSVSIPHTITGLPVTSIGYAAFDHYSSLNGVMIPSSVTNIGSHAFTSCASLSAIMVEALNAVYGSAEGVLFNKNQTTLIQCPGGKAGSYTVPNSVTNLADRAFVECTNLTAVYFQGNAPSLGSDPFEGDDHVTVYYLPGTSGWGPICGGRPTALWKPQAQTGGDSFGMRTDCFGFNITWASGRVVVVEACTDLAIAAWRPAGTNTLAGESSYFSDAQCTNYPARYYRVRWP